MSDETSAEEGVVNRCGLLYTAYYIVYWYFSDPTNFICIDEEQFHLRVLYVYPLVYDPTPRTSQPATTAPISSSPHKEYSGHIALNC